jgi:hypothetical protein
LPKRAVSATLDETTVILSAVQQNDSAPYEPPKSPIAEPKPPEEEKPLWARPSILDWYSNLGLRGRLRWLSYFLLAVNGLCLPFGFYMPKMLIVAIVGIFVSFLIPDSMDD